MHRHKYSKTKIVTAFLICIIFLTCAPKPFIWQGRYVDISTTELPKEDVKAGNYLIVAYTPNEKAKNSLQIRHYERHHTDWLILFGKNT